MDKNIFTVTQYLHIEKLEALINSGSVDEYIDMTIHNELSTALKDKALIEVSIEPIPSNFLFPNTGLEIRASVAVLPVERYLQLLEKENHLNWIQNRK